MKNKGSLLSFRRIYYRGKLNSCNYTCSYCPFGKKSHLADTTQDEQAWNRFIAAIEQLSERNGAFGGIATGVRNFLSD